MQEPTLKDKTFTLSYKCGLLLSSIYSPSTWFFLVKYTQRLRENNNCANWTANSAWLVSYKNIWLSLRAKKSSFPTLFFSRFTCALTGEISLWHLINRLVSAFMSLSDFGIILTFEIRIESIFPCRILVKQNFPESKTMKALLLHRTHIRLVVRYSRCLPTALQTKERYSNMSTFRLQVRS